MTAAVSLVADRRPTERVTAVAIRLDTRPPAPTQRNGGATSRDRRSVDVDEFDVAAHHQRTSRGDGDTRRHAVGGVGPAGLRSGHFTIVRDGRR